jgi:hypothetical protein
MARISTKAPAVEVKALKAETKSEGMRILYEAGYKVSEVAKVFGVGYAFAYGVAQRAGFAETAANRKATKATPKVAKSTSPRAAKAPARKPAVKATAANSKPMAHVGTTKATIAKTKPAPQVKRPGRPTAARRAANRKA